MSIFVLPVQAQDSLNCSLVGHWAQGPCYASAVRGDTAYFGNGCYLEIVDFTDPANPVELGEYTAPSVITDVVV